MVGCKKNCSEYIVEQTAKDICEITMEKQKRERDVVCSYFENKLYDAFCNLSAQKGKSFKLYSR